MMTVLSVLHGNTYGGPHNRNVRVAPVLRETYGFEPIVLIPEEPGNAAERMRGSGLAVVEVPIPRLRARRDPRYHVQFLTGLRPAIERIRAVIRERGVDLVQINGISNPHAALAARKEGVPVVWQILDTVSPPWFRRLMMPYVLRTAGALMATGERVAAAHPGALAAKDRLVYFYPPVDVDRFRWDRTQAARARQELGLPAETPVVGNVSNLNPQKGHRTFVQAAARLKAERVDARFVILGRTYAAHRRYFEGLMREARQLGLRPGEDLIVQEPGERVAELAMAFDLFVMTPEPRSEGIPTVIEEAMALGLPVVAADVGSIREVVLDGETGRLVPPRDPEAVSRAMTELLDDARQRRAMAGRATSLAHSAYGVDRCAESHVRAYGLALGRQLGASPDPLEVWS